MCLVFLPIHFSSFGHNWNGGARRGSVTVAMKKQTPEPIVERGDQTSCDRCEL